MGGLFDEAGKALEFAATLDHADELDAELRLSLAPGTGSLPAMIHHPLMITFYDDSQDSVERYNLVLKAVREQYQAALTREDYEEALLLHVTRPYRSIFFDMFADKMSDQEYWRLAGRLWIDQENPEDFPDEWKARFTAERPEKHHIMTESEREAFDALPDTFTIYRGGPEAKRDVLSWTTDLKTARWFADRYKGGHPVWRSTIAKTDALALWLGRGESEVVVLDHTTLGDIERMPDEDPSPGKEVN